MPRPAQYARRTLPRLHSPPHRQQHPTARPSTVALEPPSAGLSRRLPRIPAPRPVPVHPPRPARPDQRPPAPDAERPPPHPPGSPSTSGRSVLPTPHTRTPSPHPHPSPTHATTTFGPSTRTVSRSSWAYPASPSRIHSRLGERHRFGTKTKAGKQRCVRGDGSDHTVAFGAEFDHRAGWGDRSARGDRARGVTPGSEAGGLAGRVGATDLSGSCEQRTDAQGHRAHQGREGDGGLDRHRTRIGAESDCAATTYTLVLSALSMMLVSALTMLSPVTTP